MHLARRVRQLPLSVTLALDARAKALAAEGRDVVNMAVGEPDFPAPAVVREAASARVSSGDVKYTPAAGEPVLREAIARWLQETRGAAYAPADVVVCHSAKHALSGAMMTLLDPDDEMLLMLPCWVSCAEQVRIAGGTPIGVPGRADCGPDFQALERAVTDRTRAVLVNSPNNPSGYVWTPEETCRLVEFAERRDLWIVSDEIYRRLVYADPPPLSPASPEAGGRERTLVVDGASKSFAMTGYRIGFLAGPREAADAVARLHSQMTGCPNAVSQAAYARALEGEPEQVEEMVRAFAARRRLLLDGLAEIGLQPVPPRGAFYVFPDVSHLLDERGSAGFCEDLLEQEALALVPGTAFWAEGFVRLSYATSEERIGEALRRLGRFLRNTERGNTEPGSISRTIDPGSIV